LTTPLLLVFKVTAAVAVDAVPKNANGKDDRDALAAPWARERVGMRRGADPRATLRYRHLRGGRA